MDPDYWGAHFWRFMHVLIRDHYDFATTPALLTKLGCRLLPCRKCRKHFSARLNRHPVPRSRNSPTILQRWLIGVHNEVNAEKGKAVLTQVQALDEIARMRSVACHAPFVLHAIHVNIEGTRIFEPHHPQKVKDMQRHFDRFIAMLHASLRKSCKRMSKCSRCWAWLEKDVDISSLHLPPIRKETLAIMRKKRTPRPRSRHR